MFGLKYFPCLLLLLCTNAQAYVLPSNFIIRLMAETRRAQRIQDLSVQLSTNAAAATGSYDEHLYIKQGGALRRVSHRDVEEIVVSKMGAYAKGRNEKLTRQKGGSVDLTAVLLLPGNRNIKEMAVEVIALLERLGIDTKVSSLGRDGDRYVYIIGARSWEADKPQVWIGKESLLPTRFRVKTMRDGKATFIDTHFKEYGSQVAGNFFPRVIESFENGNLVYRSEVNELKRNQNLPETLFRLP